MLGTPFFTRFTCTRAWFRSIWSHPECDDFGDPETVAIHQRGPTGVAALITHQLSTVASHVSPCPSHAHATHDGCTLVRSRPLLVSVTTDPEEMLYLRGSRKIDESQLDIGTHQFDAHSVADVEALESIHDFPFDRWMRDSHPRAFS